MTSRFGITLLVLTLLLSVAVRNATLFLLDVILLFIAFTAWLWGRYCLTGVSYVRRFDSDRLFFGEETDLWIEVVNAKPLPLTWLRAEDEFPQEFEVRRADMKLLHRPQRRLMLNLYSLRWYERVRRRYRLKCDRRGAYDVGPVQMASGDLFGFRIQRTLLERIHTVLVYPKIVPLDQLGLPAAKPLGDFGSERRIMDDPLRMASVRDYQAGDSVRYLHWKATAHRSTLQTKVFDPSAALQWIVCLNTQTLDHIYEGVVTDHLETAIVVAASIAHAGLETGRSVGLLSNSPVRESQHWIQLAASRHPLQGTSILESLAQLVHPPLVPFEQMLHLAALRLPFGASIFAVTPIVNEAIIAALLDLRAKDHPVALITVGRRTQHAIPAELPLYQITQNWTDMQTLQLESVRPAG